MNLSNPTAVLNTDILFTWYSEITHANCQCRLRIYKITFDKTIVIVSELPDNPGRTISDEALTLIHLVCYKFGLNLNKTMWLENYPKGYLKDEETYDEVMLSEGKISSKRINKLKIETLLGVTL